ncbi:hypothetical protein Lal_00002100 [Lupinus albus]|uniref:Putative transcription factor C2H2 family n=1 Tax=Lupinus albus TaxID=3870 RepID=A0A6A5P877_LUPAL|nr:putative transcription factor C2H2 family [Lupinus albus]KAF1893603.1 hypothetical protein Lal_00002100 [Lupinus albus]
MARPVPEHLYSTTHHHIVDITPPSYEASTSTSTQDANFDVPNNNAATAPVSQLSNESSSRNSSLLRRGDGSRRLRSPLNSGFWISIELVVTICQIVASVVVLSLSRHEHPSTPLFEWIVGYASGCVATLPLLYWRYYHGNRLQQQDTSQSHQSSPSISGPSGRTLRSTSRMNGEGIQVAAASPRSNQASWLMNARLKILVEYIKMAINCFFAVWFIAGNIWIFGVHSSANEAPNLYRLCIVFLTFSCIGYAMPLIFCATICCCLPCIISILGVRGDLIQTQGATSESINALPTYNFKMKTNNSRDENNSVADEGGIVAAGTEKERLVSGEDAVCCICLAKYENNDQVRELPCSHLFHKDCIDKWLKISALCPLCKCGVGEKVAGSVSGEGSSQQQG